MTSKKAKFDEIGYWSEIKIEIIEKYAEAYSKVLSRQPRLAHSYIDAFAGAGEHSRKSTGELVAGSPRAALEVQPPFFHYYFIELEQSKVGHLRSLSGSRPDVTVSEGDCNQVLLRDVFPKVRYEDFQRGLCVLDPYGLHLDWKVIAEAGAMKSIEVFLNFPVADINRNVLWRNPVGVDPSDIARMTAFWGDESWRHVAYRTSPQGELFGPPTKEKADNEVIAEAFQSRLRDVAGFKYVPSPLPMRNSNNAIVYYLYFASQNATGNRIAKAIFNSYRKRGF